MEIEADYEKLPSTGVFLREQIIFEAGQSVIREQS